MPPESEDQLVQLNCRVQVGLLDRVKAAARQADLTTSQWIRQAMREKLDRGV